MGSLLRFIFLCVTLCMGSCSTPFDAYLRNMSKGVAIVNVFLLDQVNMESLPNRVKVADRILDFKSGYKKYLDGKQHVIWVDIGHFKLEIQPGTTVDLTDMAGRFMNSHPMGDVRVTITTTGKTDTLINGRLDFRRDLFGYRGRGFANPVLFYDIK